MSSFHVQALHTISALNFHAYSIMVLMIATYRVLLTLALTFYDVAVTYETLVSIMVIKLRRVMEFKI